MLRAAGAVWKSRSIKFTADWRIFLVFYVAGSRQQMKSYKKALLASLDNDVKRSIGHQAEDFILECNWKGEVCGPE